MSIQYQICACQLNITFNTKYLTFKYINIYSFLSFTVWRHVDKTGPEGNIDAVLQHGQGAFLF